MQVLVVEDDKRLAVNLRSNWRPNVGRADSSRRPSPEPHRADQPIDMLRDL